MNVGFINDHAIYRGCTNVTMQHVKKLCRSICIAIKWKLSSLHDRSEERIGVLNIKLCTSTYLKESELVHIIFLKPTKSTMCTIALNLVHEGIHVMYPGLKLHVTLL